MFDEHIRIPMSKTELIIFLIKPIPPLNIPPLGLWQHHQLSYQVRKQEVSHISGSSLGVTKAPVLLPVQAFLVSTSHMKQPADNLAAINSALQSILHNH